MPTAAESSAFSPLPVRVKISVEAHHLPQFSRPEAQTFAYVVRLDNEDDQTWKLLRRFWLVVDAQGQRTEVEGEGVVGQQPLLTPGTVFVYDSFVTVSGAPAWMSGYYTLENAWGEQRQVAIPEFQLVTGSVRLMN
ncbi:protein ApaG [Deinococcus piscis]|uniref:Protein ApaG n=1 Tax=Deinococcus piscis TaxID=394230 RepID=A0ABQ3K530_9DEIO|nr:Co2+/Mg2+ efflux protein ApaG [Deinococcus piscis]GHG04096.1 protein ApaG [Deinococcus piscis]